MILTRRLVLLSFFIFLTSCSTPTANLGTQMTDTEPNDAYLWLEEVESPKALDWAKTQNLQSTSALEKDSRYKTVEAEISKIILSKDRIPFPNDYANGEAFNFWQDEKSVRGIWRKTKLSEYQKPNPVWDTILDLDAFAQQENENWVWKGADCSPNQKRCLVGLSRGGKDAKVVREFDLATKAFVKDGFILPEAKSRVTWFDDNTVFVGTDYGAGSMTSSGYPRIVKIWKRGMPLSEAKTVFTGDVSDVSSTGFALWDGMKHQGFIVRSPSFYTNLYYWIDTEGKPQQLELPDDIDIHGLLRDQLLVSFRKDFYYENKLFKAGSLVAFAFKAGNLGKASALFEPTSTRALAQVGVTKDAVYVSAIEDVKARLSRFTKKGNAAWAERNLDIPDHGAIHLVISSPYEKLMAFSYESFLIPSTLRVLDSSQDNVSTVIKTSPARFNSSSFEVSQHFVDSKDGVSIPYFQISKKNLKEDGSNPTLVYGYGGFENALNPFYLNAIGKAWLEKGGVYVVANIRGGGEYGPQWHQAGLLKNRQKVFDDFIAVTEDLISRKVTTPQHVGIRGGSNGGLLVGAALTQRPDLFGAVVCEVPLLDMLRYHKLLAGASWMAEYGNPDEPEMEPYIRAYSPFQNVKKDMKYPKTFFLTSTKDDRVHPGHARKMVAKMKDQGHDVLYFENIEGGHGAAANLQQVVRRSALIYTYLYQQLVDPTKTTIY